MIALLSDEDFNGRIIRGLIRSMPDLDLLTAHGVGLAGLADPEVIAWASANKRVLLTHDLNTMIEAALIRVRAGKPMSGVIGVPQWIGIGAAVADIALLTGCLEREEFEDQIRYLPL